MIAALTHRTGNLCLDKPFDLIEGHPCPVVRRRRRAKTCAGAKAKKTAVTEATAMLSALCCSAELAEVYGLAAEFLFAV